MPLTPVLWSNASSTAQLYFDDCFTLMERLAPASVDCIWTDPPYFLSGEHRSTCHAGKRAAIQNGAWDESAGIAFDHAFNRRWLAACYRLLRPNGTIWVSGTHHVYCSVGMAMAELGLRVLNDIVWQKTTPPPNLGCRCFTHATELLLWATKARKGSADRYTFNYAAMKAENGGTQMQNVWRMPAAGQAEKRLGRHPTQKPLALVARCLRASTNPGDLVFDPFAGSATTGVAALQEGRRFLGCEQDAEHYALAAARLSECDLLTRDTTTSTIELCHS